MAIDPKILALLGVDGGLLGNTPFPGTLAPQLTPEEQLLQIAANPQAVPQAPAPSGFSEPRFEGTQMVEGGGGEGFLNTIVNNPALSRALTQAGLGLLGAGTSPTDPRRGDIGFGLVQGAAGAAKSLEQSEAIRRQDEQQKFNNAIKLAQVGGAPKSIFKVVEDASSPSGFSFLDLNNPQAPPIPNAPKPGTGTTIQISPGEKEEEKAIGKFRAQTFVDTQKGGKSARGKINRYGQLEDILTRVDTGRLTGVKKSALEIAEAFNVTLPGAEQLGDLQAFEALTNQLALSVRSTADGEGMPGQLSDNDIKFLKASIPNLQKTNEGNRLIIEAGKRLEVRKIAMAKLAREYRQEHGTLDAGFFEEAERFHETNPLFPDLIPLADAILAAQPTAPETTTPGKLKFNAQGQQVQ